MSSDAMSMAPAQGRLFRLVLLAAGPFLTLAAVRMLLPGHVSAWELPMAEAAAFLAWSPLFFSVPALLCQRERDAALPHLRGVAGSALRAVILVPWLLSPRSSVRAETAVSLLAWLAMVPLVAPALASVSSYFAG